MWCRWLRRSTRQNNVDALLRRENPPHHSPGSLQIHERRKKSRAKRKRNPPKRHDLRCHRFCDWLLRRMGGLGAPPLALARKEKYCSLLRLREIRSFLLRHDRTVASVFVGSA